MTCKCTHAHHVHTCTGTNVHTQNTDKCTHEHICTLTCPYKCMHTHMQCVEANLVDVEEVR